MSCSVAVVPTDRSARYLGQLVAHFADRLPARVDGDAGRIEFPIGVCTALAGDSLVLTCEAEAENLTLLEDVIASLARFAFREPELKVSWVQADW